MAVKPWLLATVAPMVHHGGGAWSRAPQSANPEHYRPDHTCMELHCGEARHHRHVTDGLFVDAAALSLTLTLQRK